MKDKEIICSKDLAGILGFTVRRLQQLTNEIPLEQASRGKYELGKTIQKYIEWIQAKEEEKRAGNALENETLLLTRAKREKAEAEVKIIKGELHYAEDVMILVGDMIANARARILDLPAKLSPQVIGRNDMEKVREIVNNEIKTVLESLAEYNPEDYAKRNKKRFKGATVEDEDTR